MKEEWIYDLTIKLLDDGSVELGQNIGSGERWEVTLQRCHLRHLFERLGYLENAADDGLAMRLARQLIALRSDLTGGADGSAAALARLDALIETVLQPAGLLDDKPPHDGPQAQPAGQESLL